MKKEAILHGPLRGIDLEQFQLESPGFNFRGANSDKKYEEQIEVLRK